MRPPPLQQGDGLRQIIADGQRFLSDAPLFSGCRNQRCQMPPLSSAAHQNGLTACRAGGHGVGYGVTDEKATFQVQPMVARRLYQQAGGRFAARTLFIGAMGANVNLIDATTRIRNGRLHPFIDDGDIRGAQYAPSNGGLVGDHQHRRPQSGQTLHGVQCARQENELAP